MIAIADYGAGNLFSVKNALDYIGLENIITGESKELELADGVILPGVGAFPDAMRMLQKKGLDKVLKEQAKKKPLLGICLGMQILFSKGTEFAKTEGLGLIEGSVDLIECGQKIPHIGFNELEFNVKSPLLNGIAEKSAVYFVHSYMANTSAENVAAYCDYSIKIPALVQSGDNIFGAQFHPEKSGDVGLTILKNFGGLTK